MCVTSGTALRVIESMSLLTQINHEPKGACYKKFIQLTQENPRTYRIEQVILK